MASQGKQPAKIWSVKLSENYFLERAKSVTQLVGGGYKGLKIEDTNIFLTHQSSLE